MRLKAVMAGTAAAVVLAAGQASAATVTVQPTGAAQAANCFPTGRGDSWTPFMGFVYKDIPAFSLQPGDRIAFDTWALNESDIQVTVELAPTTSNGSDVPAGPYTRVVTDTQVASNPRGNTTVNDFDLGFTVERAFNFAGGGLVIRFSDPGTGFAGDSVCTSNLGGAGASDASGFFVKRFYSDADGLPPYTGSDAGDIGSFQVQTFPHLVNNPPPPPDTTKPVLSSVGLSSKVFRAAKSGPSFSRKKKPPVGTKVSFTLSEPGSVKFTVDRKAKGRKVGKKCVAKKKSNRKKKSCTRWVKLKGSFTVAGKQGKNSFKFRGRLRGKALKPGSYRLDSQAADPSKNKSKTRRANFRIVR